MATLLITILPSLLIVLFFVKSDRFPEPTSQIIKIFMFGVFLCIPAFYINTALVEIYSNTNISEALIRSFLSAYYYSNDGSFNFSLLTTLELLTVLSGLTSI